MTDRLSYRAGEIKPRKLASSKAAQRNRIQIHGRRGKNIAPPLPSFPSYTQSGGLMRYVTIVQFFFSFFLSFFPSQRKRFAEISERLRSPNSNKLNETCRNRRSPGFYDLSLMKFDLVILVDFFRGKKETSYRFDLLGSTIHEEPTVFIVIRFDLRLSSVSTKLAKR